MNGRDSFSPARACCIIGLAISIGMAKPIPVAVDERSTTVAGIYGCVRLDQAMQARCRCRLGGRHLDVAAESGDDSSADAVGIGESEGTADGDGELADQERGRVAECGHGQIRYAIDLDDGEVRQGVETV